MKFAIPFLFLLALLSASLNLSAQPRRGAGPGAPSRGFTEKVGLADDSDPENNFNEKGLPEPPVIGAKPTEALGVSYAKRVARYDEDSLGLLTAVLRKSGFHIIDSTGRTLYSPSQDSDLGIAFFDFEVIGMLKASKLGVVSSLDQMADTMAKSSPSLKNIASSQLMLSDLRTGRTSKHASVKFMTGFLFELGRHLPQPADLAVGGPDQKISMIQAAMIERLLLRDFFGLIESTEGLDAKLKIQPNLYQPKYSTPQFINASYVRPRDESTCSIVSDITSLQKAEGTVKKIIEKILLYKQLFDWNTMEKGFDKSGVPSGVLKKDILKDYSKSVKWVNIGLAWAKLVMALANVKIKVDVEDPMPLIRTKYSRQPGGEVRALTAKISIDFPSSSTLNCVGQVFSTFTGLSFSVPKNGPMKDVPVSWEIAEEGSFTEALLSSPVYLDSQDGRGTDKQTTNSLGESRAKLTGKPQKRDLSNYAVVPDPKKASVRVRVATEKMDAGKDIPKIFNTMFGPDLAGIGILQGILSLAPEMLGKIKLASQKVQIPVRDWRPCSEDWGGYIKAVHDFSKTEVIVGSTRSNGNSTGKGIRRQQIRNEIYATLKPRTPEEMASNVPPHKAVADLRGFVKDITELTRDKDPCCGKDEGSFDTKERRGMEMSYVKSQNVRAGVNVRITERDFSIGFDIPTEPFDVMYRRFNEVESTCPMEQEQNFSKEELETFFALNWLLPNGRYGDRTVTDGADVVIGTKTTETPQGKFTWEWALARCRN